MPHALTRYHALYESLRSRRRRPVQHKGLDLAWAHTRMKMKHASVSLAWLRDQALSVEKIGETLRSHSDAALSEVVRECRELMVRGREDQSGVQRSLAAVREVARRETGENAYTVQIMGALALLNGRIVEMVTGEGKTLTGSLAAPLIAWRHKYLHVLTVNDYLAARDAQSRAAIYARCGCAVGAITQSMDPAERYDVYARPICYGTPKQITADWLRDQLRLGSMSSPWAGRGLLNNAGGSESGPMIPGLRACMVDEADAVLIDEGVVPLIIARSRREDDMAPVYQAACHIAMKLDQTGDYTIDLLQRRAELTRRGKHRCHTLFEAQPDAIWRATRRAEELIRQALIAKHCYLRGHQYQIVDGQIVIVDEYTGRFLPDRSWEHGLHQSVEAKEGLEVTADRETLARMSFQRFFRTYPFLAGMTGTAADAAVEMSRVYERPVSVIPTNRPIIRQAWPTRAFCTMEAKWNAIVQSVQDVHATRRPVLVGTRSIEASELLSERLTARGIVHRVLNANFDKEEAELVAMAGKHSTVTVATNMAGRGTDIKLDRESREAGGLHVLLTEMHSSRRVDRQFIGRSGRQGDPGSSQVFVSLEDELVRLHAPKLGKLFKGAATSEELTGSAAGRAIWLMHAAQRKAEARARRQRSDVLKQDDWIERYMPGR